MLDSVNVMGLPFVNTDMATLVADLDGRLSRAEQTFLVTANPEIMTYAHHDPDYMRILKSADLVTPDGVGVVIASKILGKPIKERLAGFDLVQQLLHLCSERSYRIYFLGAQPEMIDQAVTKVKASHPPLEIAGYHHGYFDLGDESIIQDVQSANPDVILVGLGFPRQEQWIERYRHFFNKGLFLGVGGSFDTLAGKSKRAPVIWQKLNLEWLYRLAQHPSRWRRMLVIPGFIWRAVKVRFTGEIR